MLIVVVIGDGQADDGSVVRLLKQIHWNAAAEAGKTNRIVPGRRHDRLHFLGKRRVQRRARGRVAVSPIDLDEFRVGEARSGVRRLAHDLVSERAQVRLHQRLD